MTEPEYAAFADEMVPEYARDKVKSGQWSETEAPALSRQALAELLPDGLRTPGHHFCTLRDPATSDAVGFLWFAEKEQGGTKIAYIYNIAIKAEHRRKGHGAGAMTALEKEARSMGLAGIGLHVFGHNAPAQALYARVGYRTTNINMFKAL